MKVKLFLVAILIMSSVINNQSGAQTSSSGKKILIVYYSWGGNTRNMAEQIKTATGADIFEIVPKKAYPTDYTACTVQAKDEINRKHKPEITDKVDNFDQYDIIIIGSPNWWSTIAPPVATFLSSYNFSGKTILPFITHEGSRMGRSETDIKALCTDAIMFKGLPVRGGSVKNAGNDIQKWLSDNAIIK